MGFDSKARKIRHRLTDVSASFGIGTYLTNDFSKVSDPTKISKPLNIVIKLSRIDGHDCVKLSDDKGKVRDHAGSKFCELRADRNSTPAI